MSVSAGVGDLRRAVMIDDDRALCTLVEQALSGSGWQLECFCDPHEAMAQLRSRPPEVLIVDVRMPTLDGDEILDELAETGCLEGVMIFASSSAEPPRSIWERFEKHGARFIPKDGLIEASSAASLLPT